MRALAIVGFALIATLPGLAAGPPELIGYQGVLRDGTTGAPLDGSFDMVFRLFTSEFGGLELLVDEHTAATGHPVEVEDGLFRAQVGGGVISEGAGPGVTCSSLGCVFKRSSVWMLVEVNGEPFDARVRMLASSYAMNSLLLGGKQSDYFLDVTDVTQVKDGKLILVGGNSDYGLQASGTIGGGLFTAGEDSGWAQVAAGDSGIVARGDATGGSFADGDESGRALVARGDYGIDASGQEAGGYFRDQVDPPGAFARLGYTGPNAAKYGVWAEGELAGGYFTGPSGMDEAYLASGGYGIVARGEYSGGLFEPRQGAGSASLATGDTGVWATGKTAVHAEGDERGVRAYGLWTGGYFADKPSSANTETWLARTEGTTTYGVDTLGSTAGRFESIHGTEVKIAHEGMAIYASSDFGSVFNNTLSGAWASLAAAGVKIEGTGSMGFVQNHPADDEKNIIYMAPEGDEVATYTRGTARLVAGQARVGLGETFKWVTNPDIGLTVHLTPRGACLGLYAESLTTEEIVVRELGDGSSDTVFDYIVYGLRIGFEDHAVVRVREREARIPSPKMRREMFRQRPELLRYTALERYKDMRHEVGASREPDLTRAQTLLDAIKVFDPAVRRTADPQSPERNGAPESSPIGRVSRVAREGRDEVVAGWDQGSVKVIRVDDDGEKADLTPSPFQGNVIPSTESVEAGDVLVMDSDRAGFVKRAGDPADTRVFGVVASDPQERGRTSITFLNSDEDSPAALAPVVFSGVVSCKVDAGYGAIRPGDLLTTSPTTGHAMRADAPQIGTILGKAVDALDTGTGHIRILVTLR